MEVPCSQESPTWNESRSRYANSLPVKCSWGDASEACLELGRLECCQVRIAAGYGQMSTEPQPIPCDQFIWILDGHADIYDATGTETRISQGESTVLYGGEAYRLVFPQLSIYLLVEPEGDA